ncbi:hypothetical protein L6452_47019 [Arctium lappa]|nr:hypothetical protein L6452_47019 [Arctium lappa]
MTPTCRLATTLDRDPSDGGRRCVPVGCGTARAGPPIDSGRGPVRIGAAAKARAVDMPVEIAVASIVGWQRAPSRRASAPACSRHRPAGTPFGPS